MAIDRKKIIDEMSKVSVESNEEGIIEGFNVMVNQLPAAFWNSFAERLSRKATPEMMEATEFLLVNAAQECGYHTGYGIITSEEWNKIVGPMIEKVPEDILYGAYAVFSAWGWANAEVVELIPNEKMVIRAYNYYESDVVKFGKSHKMSAYMIRGVSAAFMALAYAGPYSSNNANDIVHTFKCDQVKGIECGDEYGEFIVTKA
ncbi:MAG TPA: hypothetical protein PKY56_05950 [Candidatus Kapabacteria bacterium]|nr:hypothetical protein [Candidatus Kapabacteria bacterium]